MNCYQHGSSSHYSHSKALLYYYLRCGDEAAHEMAVGSLRSHYHARNGIAAISLAAKTQRSAFPTPWSSNLWGLQSVQAFSRVSLAKLFCQEPGFNFQVCAFSFLILWGQPCDPSQSGAAYLLEEAISQAEHDATLAVNQIQAICSWFEWFDPFLAAWNSPGFWAHRRSSQHFKPFEVKFHELSPYRPFWPGFIREWPQPPSDLHRSRFRSSSSSPRSTSRAIW